MLNRSQDQAVAAGASAYQAGGNMTVVQNYGVTEEHARDVALEVFRANAPRLAKEAGEEAASRILKFLEWLFRRLQRDHSPELHQFLDPDFQCVYLACASAFARSGSPHVGETLVELLAKRSKEPTRGVLQMVLNESVEAVRMLTTKQIDLLSIVFLWRYMPPVAVADQNEFGSYLDSHLRPLVETSFSGERPFPTKADALHLEYSRCTLHTSVLDLGDILKRGYQGLFQRGLPNDELEALGTSTGIANELLGPCLNDSSLQQINFQNQFALLAALRTANVEHAGIASCLRAFDQNSMDAHELYKKCVSIRPYMKTMYDLWEGTLLKRLELSNVGIAIAHSNLSRHVKLAVDLPTWID